MIEPRLIEELKESYKGLLVKAGLILVFLTYLSLLVPSPEFEQGLTGKYSGKTLLENVPEKYEYLHAYIRMDGVYQTEGFAFIFMIFGIAVLTGICMAITESIFEKLRQFDTPPPVIPEKDKTIDFLLTFGGGVFITSVTLLSAIWHCLSPEYLFTGTGLWSAVFANFPFWALVAGMIFLIATNELLTQIIKQRKTEEKEALNASSAKQEGQTSDENTDDQLVATVSKDGEDVVINIAEGVTVNQLNIGYKKIVLTHVDGNCIKTTAIDTSTLFMDEDEIEEMKSGTEAAEGGYLTEKRKAEEEEGKDND